MKAFGKRNFKEKVMNIPKEKVIGSLCAIVMMVHQSTGGFSDGKACDCFCSHMDPMDFRSFAFERPDLLDFIRKAVEEKLARERNGIK